MTTTTLRANSARIESIDVLRGFSLLGIIIVHMVEQYYAGSLPESVMKAAPHSVADDVVSGLVGFFVIGKFYMIFSFLFGMSFYIQFSKSEGDHNFLLRFTWRLIILFAIGFLHSLHYRGDILTIYAVLGIPLLLFHRLPNRLLLVFALALVFDIPTVITRGFQAVFPSGNPFELNQSELMGYYRAVKSGTYGQILSANVYEILPKFDFQIASGRLYITFGLFLLGIYAGRKRFFENISAKIGLLKKFRFYSWMGVIAVIVSGLAFFGITQLLKVTPSDAVNMLIGGFLYDFMNACLATIYVIWILLWLQNEKWKARLMYLYPVGRMGLTTYLMQTVFGTLIYFSYGLGLLNEFGALPGLLLALILFAVQILFARWWFTKFSFGPVEWLWRNLTYLKIHPLLRPGTSAG